MSHHVLLLRAPADNEAEDEYHVKLSTHGYTPRSINPLDTEIRNLDLLASAMCSPGPENHYDGVIMTSSRSAEVWTATMNSNAFDKQSYLEKWKGASFYVVGAKTASLLEEALCIEGSRPIDIRIEGAAESGNAEKLAEYIARTADGDKRRLLYLTGDKNRDTLPNKINESGVSIELVPLQVYATCENSLLRSEIRGYGEGIRSDPSLQPTADSNIWIVFFAPSSSSYALSHLKKEFRFRFTGSDRHGPGDDSKPRAIPVSIGPTTASYLREVGMDLDIVCKQPDPGSLIHAIETHRFNP